MSEDVFRRARELEEEFFDSMIRFNRPDVVLDEDGGLRWGDTCLDGKNAEREAETAEQALCDFLSAHRSELESEPHWRVYLADLERVGLLEQPAAPDPVERRRADRAEWAQRSSAAPTPPASPEAGRPRGLSR